MTLASPMRSAEFRPWRFAIRELRGGLHGFRIFVACIALGVMAIAGVGSFSASLTDGLAREGQRFDRTYSPALQQGWTQRHGCDSSRDAASVLSADRRCVLFETCI